MPSANEFFLNCVASVVLVETIIISHPNFSKTYKIVRNVSYGFHATDELGTQHDFEYYPLKIQRSGAWANLDQSLKITIGDLGTLIPDEIERVRVADGFSVKPSLVYRAYRSDDTSAPMYGPYNLELLNIPMTAEGASFEALAPIVNKTQTGEAYTLERFPGLRGYM